MNDIDLPIFSRSMTHSTRLKCPIIINRTSLFSVLRAIQWYFHSYSNISKTYCKQTVETQSRHRFWSIWSGSALFAHVPQKGRYAYMGLTVNTGQFTRTCVWSFLLKRKWIHKHCFIFHCYRSVGKVIEEVNAQKTTFMIFSFRYLLVAPPVIIIIGFKW